MSLCEIQFYVYEILTCKQYNGGNVPHSRLQSQAQELLGEHNSRLSRIRLVQFAANADLTQIHQDDFSSPTGNP